HRQCTEPDGVARDAPAGLRLPPMVDYGYAKNFLGPLNCRRVGTLAGEEKRAEFREVVFPDHFPFGIFLLDRAEGGGRGEQRDDAVLGDYTPESARIRRSHRLAFVKDRRAAVKQRRVDDIGMADDPADIRARPPYFAGRNAVEILHRPFESNQMAAIVAYHAFRNSSRAGRIKDVKRIGGGNG